MMILIALQPRFTITTEKNVKKIIIPRFELRAAVQTIIFSVELPVKLYLKTMTVATRGLPTGHRHE